MLKQTQATTVLWQKLQPTCRLLCSVVHHITGRVLCVSASCTHHAQTLQAPLQVALDVVGQLASVVSNTLAVEADRANLQQQHTVWVSCS
jgi:hypothetical protein